MTNTPYKQSRNEVRLLALDMCVGESRTEYCPFCGATHEKSLSITKEETGIVYNCFRASCKTAGFIPLIDGSAPIKRNKPDARPFTRPLKEVSPKLLGHLNHLYGFTQEDIDRGRFKYDYTEQRLYMPIITEDGYESGAVSKSLIRNKNITKTLNYYWSPLCNLHVADSRILTPPLVVVEDILSATKVARYAQCVALLGTSMNVEQAIRLSTINKQIVMALDGDTWSKGTSIAHKMKNKYGLLFVNFSIVKLSNRDPKEMTEEEIRETILA